MEIKTSCDVAGCKSKRTHLVLFDGVLYRDVCNGRFDTMLARFVEAPSPKDAERRLVLEDKG